VKAEEASLQPFSSVSFDTEAIICCLEDSLVACEKVEQENKSGDTNVAACRILAKLLVTAILKARGETASMRCQMDELGIDPSSSALGRLLVSCASELGLSSSSPLRHMTKDVASLVSTVGSAPQGPERNAAIDALRCYKATHGDEELNDHLNEVSGAFRAFILEQLSESASKEATESTSASSMSERIKSLRSKLNATEAVVQSAVERVDSRDSHPVQTRPSMDSGIQRPSPSKLPVFSASSGTATGSVSVRAFRERLAAAQEKRSVENASPSDVIPQPTVTAGSRAATLRLRLQAVKKQSEEQEY
jgi:hypothetical protein